MKTESGLNIPNAQQSAHPFVLHDERGPDGEAFLEGLFGPGLTKLELLAGMAMQGMAGQALQKETLLLIKTEAGKKGMKIRDWLSVAAIEQAQSLLSELEKAGKP